MILSFFILLSLVYVVFGVMTAVRVVRHWPALKEAELAASDRLLAGRAAFYLGVPLVVLVHELAHAVLIWALGLKVVDFTYLGYMGFVVASGSAGALGDFWINAAGNLSTFGLGALSLLIALWLPGVPARNIFFFHLGREALFLVLVFYPGICLAGFQGDFVRIYDFSATPIASAVAAVVHGSTLLFGYAWFWPRYARTRGALVCSSTVAQLISNEKRLRDTPGDLDARQNLGFLHLVAGDYARAERMFSEVNEAGRTSGPLLLALGQARLRLKQHTRALDALNNAEPRLLRPEDRRRARLESVEALLGCQRPEEALAVATALRADLPTDDAVFAAWVLTMVKAGKKAEARAEIDRLTATETGARRHLLRRLYDEAR